MKYINSSTEQLYVVVNGQTTLVSPGKEIESKEAIKCIGLKPIIPPTKKKATKKKAAVKITRKKAKKK